MVGRPRDRELGTNKLFTPGRIFIPLKIFTFEMFVFHYHEFTTIEMQFFLSPKECSKLGYHQALCKEFVLQVVNRRYLPFIALDWFSLSSQFPQL